jgi:hypothetical protein
MQNSARCRYDSRESATDAGRPAADIPLIRVLPINPRLTRLIMAQRDDMRLYGIDSREGRERQVASVGEHYQMIEYGLAGKVHEIGELITRHIMESKPLFAAALGLSQPQSSMRGRVSEAVPVPE